MNVSEARRALALMAHPDDAEIYCGGTLIRLAAAGWKISIATVAKGDCGSTSEPAEQIAVRRAAEARRAAAMIDAAYYCLEERDGFVVYDKLTLQKTVALFRRVGPQLVLTHSPEDYMMDHVMASLLARSASFLYSAPNICDLPVVAGSRVPHLYYCDTMEGIDILGRPFSASTYVDIAAVLEEKTRMLACHESQREWLRAHHGTDEYLEAVRRHARRRGSEVGLEAAEAFIQHRGHAYPHDDLLAKYFGPGSSAGENP